MIYPHPKKDKQLHPVETDDDVMDIDEAKRQKTVEEVKKLRLHNLVAARELCHRKQVLELIMPVMASFIDDVTTMPDAVSAEIVGQDIGDVHARLTLWCVETCRKFSEKLELAGG